MKDATTRSILPVAKLGRLTLLGGLLVAQAGCGEGAACGTVKVPERIGIRRSVHESGGSVTRPQRRPDADTKVITLGGMLR
jgi:hypothetical protein